MRKTRMLGTVLAALVALVPLAAFAQSNEADGLSYARLSFVKGDVTLGRGADLGNESAEVNLPVAAGNKLVTGDGQAEVQFGRRNFLRLGVSSEAEFAALPGRSGDPVKLHIRAGQAYIRVMNLEAEKGIEVHTPDASFYILEEGLYRFDISEGGATEVLVHEGSAEAAGEGGSVVIRSNERLVAADGEFRGDPETFSAALDGFDRWNETRDGLLDRRSGTSYLPSAISEYENELEDNGRWVNQESYGNVWVPYVQNVEWRPYLYGRWVWYPIIGWTWVSSEPWGWATYHYGRWQWGFGLGWYWIPTTHWGPAWVHWYHGRDHYGWCPLSYYDRPGVFLNGRYYDRWRGDDYPWNSRAMTVVRRDRLQSPAISRHALRSSELGALGRISLRADQPNVRPSAGRTNLASPALRPVSAAGSRATLAERGALSKGTLRSPASGSVSGAVSKGRTWTSTGKSVSSRSLSGSFRGRFQDSDLPFAQQRCRFVPHVEIVPRRRSSLEHRRREAFWPEGREILRGDRGDRSAVVGQVLFGDRQVLAGRRDEELSFDHQEPEHEHVLPAELRQRPAIRAGPHGQVLAGRRDEGLSFDHQEPEHGHVLPAELRQRPAIRAGPHGQILRVPNDVGIHFAVLRIVQPPERRPQL